MRGDEPLSNRLSVAPTGHRGRSVEHRWSGPERPFGWLCLELSRCVRAQWTARPEPWPGLLTAAVVVLSPSFKNDDCDRVTEIEAAVAGSHRQPQPLCGRELLAQSAG